MTRPKVALLMLLGETLASPPRDLRSKILWVREASAIPKLRFWACRNRPPHRATENSPIVPLESRVLGTPVVASRLGGLAEIIPHGENDLLFPPGRPEALALTLQRLEDPALRERLIAGGLRYLKEEHSVERWGERVAACYARAIQGV